MILQTFGKLSVKTAGINHSRLTPVCLVSGDFRAFPPVISENPRHIPQYLSHFRKTENRLKWRFRTASPTTPNAKERAHD